MTENIITDLYLTKLLDPTFVSYDELVNGGLGRDEKEGRGQIVQGGESQRVSLRLIGIGGRSGSQDRINSPTLLALKYYFVNL